MATIILPLVLARWSSGAESARELALPAVKLSIRDARAVIDPFRARAADRSIRERHGRRAAVPAKRRFVVLEEKSDFVRELLVLALERVVFVAQSLEQALVVAATRDHQRGSLLLHLLLQLFNARQALVGLALCCNEVAPHRSEVLLEGLDAQPQVLVFADGTLCLALHINELTAERFARTSIVGERRGTAVGTHA